MPSAVTIGSLALVLAAGVGYVVVSAASADPSASPAPTHVTPSVQVTVPPSKPVSTPDHSEPPATRKPDVVPHVLVVVFNNTGVSGLAEDKAKILQGAGWHVAATDNWYGDIPADTVYYPPALQHEAGQLAKVLHITRLHPAVAPMQFDRLTVIIATAP